MESSLLMGMCKRAQSVSFWYTSAEITPKYRIHYGANADRRCCSRAKVYPDL